MMCPYYGWETEYCSEPLGTVIVINNKILKRGQIIAVLAKTENACLL